MSESQRVRWRGCAGAGWLRWVVAPVLSACGGCNVQHCTDCVLRTVHCTSAPLQSFPSHERSGSDAVCVVFPEQHPARLPVENNARWTKAPAEVPKRAVTSQGTRFGVAPDNPHQLFCPHANQAYGWLNVHAGPSILSTQSCQQKIH